METIAQIAAPPTYGKRRYLVLAFALPILLMGTAFGLHRVYPFGDQQILVTDFWQQYYPFLSDFWYKVREGGSLLWSWTSGAGVGYPGIAAYYLSSPLNLLTVLFPHEWLQESVAVVLLIKLGAAGLFFALYLRKTYGRCDLALPVFSTFYALCAFTLGYYWNIMWFDTFALLPLVVLGLTILLKEGKFLVYVLTLALAMFTNYYIALFICYFMAILFLVHCFVERVILREFLHKLVLVALFSGIALGLTAFLTAPTFFNLRNTFRPISSFPKSLELYEKFIDIIGNFAALSAPTAIEGLPNIYCGLLSIALVPMYLRAKPSIISWREKLAYLGLVAFIIISCNLNVLNYIWHGFHFTNMLPYRFSFLVCFLLVTMAYRAYTTLDTLDFLDIVWMMISGGIVILAAIFGPQNSIAVIGSVLFLAGYGLLFFLYQRKKMNLRVFSGILAVLAIVEVGCSAWMGVETVATSSHAYPDRYDQVQQVLALRQNEENSFYRTESTMWYTLNDPAVYGYNGVSLFSSTANGKATQFMTGLGLPAWGRGNRYCYAETSPLSNAFLNIRYLFSRETTALEPGNVSDGGAYWNEVGRVESVGLFENRRYLPLGFMAKGSLAEYAREDKDLFVGQNRLFSLSTGLQQALFTPLESIGTAYANVNLTLTDQGEQEFSLVDAATPGILRWEFRLPEAGLYYAYVQVNDIDEIAVLKNQKSSQVLPAKRPYIFCVGNFAQGEEVSLAMRMEPDTETTTVNLCMGRLNQALFDTGYNLLADEPMTVDSHSGNSIVGTVSPTEDGLLYTSIPWEKGWTATVDGTAAKIVPLDGSMSTVWLAAGTHTVAFRYVPRGLVLGIGASIAALAALVAALVLHRRHPG